jgi:hypothetical protein
MAQDANQVLMGATESTFKTVDSHVGAIAAGLACVLKSDDTITTTLADGALLGVSLGKDLSGADIYVPICRKGAKVPILLQSNAVNPVIGAQVQLHATSGKADSSGTAVNAVYASGELDAVLEDGSIVTDGCALIDFPGGL